MLRSVFSAHATHQQRAGSYTPSWALVWLQKTLVTDGWCTVAHLIESSGRRTTRRRRGLGRIGWQVCFWTGTIQIHRFRNGMQRQRPRQRRKLPRCCPCSCMQPLDHQSQSRNPSQLRQSDRLQSRQHQPRRPIPPTRLPTPPRSNTTIGGLIW